MNPGLFARPVLGFTDLSIAAAATPSPLSPQLFLDNPNHPRYPELRALILEGASLRVAAPPNPGDPLPTRRRVQNHQSATTYAIQIRALLAADVAAGTTFVLDTLPPEWLAPGSGLFLCPIGAVPKSSSTPQVPVVRMIFDASHGGIQSLNSRITAHPPPFPRRPRLLSLSTQYRGDPPRLWPQYTTLLVGCQICLHERRTTPISVPIFSHCLR